MINLNSVSKKFNFNLLILLLTISCFSVSCREEDPVAYFPPEPMSYDATSDWYEGPPFAFDPNASPRKDAIGEWQDLDHKYVFKVKSVTKNPNYTPNSSEPEYFYDISSKVPEFPTSDFTQVKEISINKNNINLENKYRFIVEGTRGWLWVMSDQPYKIRLKRDNWSW